MTAQVWVGGRWHDVGFDEVDEGFVYNQRVDQPRKVRTAASNALQSMWWVNTGLQVEDGCYYRCSVEGSFVAGYAPAGFWAQYVVLASDAVANIFTGSTLWPPATPAEMAMSGAPLPIYPNRPTPKGDHPATIPAGGMTVNVPYGSASRFSSTLYITIGMYSNQLASMDGSNIYWKVHRWNRQPRVWTWVGGQQKRADRVFVRAGSAWKEVV